MRIIDAMDPAGIHVEEIADQVANVGHCEDEEEARGVRRCDRKQAKVGDKVGASEAALLNMLNISPFSYGLLIRQGRNEKT